MTPRAVRQRNQDVRKGMESKAKSNKAGGMSADTIGVVSKDPKRKYRNVPTTMDGIRFDSKREAQRYQALTVAARSGRIKDLERQVRFDLHAPNGDRIGCYVADFTYRLVAPGLASDGQLFVEDAKGVRTPLYKWKKRHTESEHNVKILEV